MAEGRPNVHPQVAEEIAGLSNKELHAAVVQLEAWSRRTFEDHSTRFVGDGGKHDRTTEAIMGAVIVEESLRVCATEP